MFVVCDVETIGPVVDFEAACEGFGFSLGFHEKAFGVAVGKDEVDGDEPELAFVDVVCLGELPLVAADVLDANSWQTSLNRPKIKHLQCIFIICMFAKINPKIRSSSVTVLKFLQIFSDPLIKLFRCQKVLYHSNKTTSFRIRDRIKNRINRIRIFNLNLNRMSPLPCIRHNSTSKNLIDKQPSTI